MAGQNDRKIASYLDDRHIYRQKARGFNRELNMQIDRLTARLTDRCGPTAVPAPELPTWWYDGMDLCEQ